MSDYTCYSWRTRTVANPSPVFSASVVAGATPLAVSVESALTVVETRAVLFDEWPAWAIAVWMEVQFA